MTPGGAEPHDLDSASLARAAREALGQDLDPAAFGALLGRDPATIQRRESGAEPLSESARALYELLVEGGKAGLGAKIIETLEMIAPELRSEKRASRAVIDLCYNEGQGAIVTRAARRG